MKSYDDFHINPPRGYHEKEDLMEQGPPHQGGGKPGRHGGGYYDERERDQYYRNMQEERFGRQHDYDAPMGYYSYGQRDGPHHMGHRGGRGGMEYGYYRHMNRYN